MKITVNDLTLEEKLNLLTGKDMWHTYGANGKLKELFMCDGPCGVRTLYADGTEKGVSFPCSCNMGNTWNEELIRWEGELIADDCIMKGTDILLAPGVNIKRTPLNGRNFEFLSEDPYLSGMLGKAFIEGVQSRGIGTCVKHFCANNREYDRDRQTSEVDERTLREIYWPAFEYTMQANPWMAMCSYNPVNGVFASENKWLLKDILRDEFGFDGVIVSDWWAVHSPYRAVKATLDLAMPYVEASYGSLKNAYDKGLITEEEINERVENILRLIEKTETEKTVKYTREEKHAAAVEIAKEGMVLLKNEGVLPFKQGNVLVCGKYATTPPLGGGGSSCVETDFVQTDLCELMNGKTNATFIRGGKESWAVEYTPPKVKDDYMRAYDSDAVLICIGHGQLVEKEGMDRTDIKLSPEQEHFILHMCKYNENVVVAVYAGSAMDMSAWIDKVKGVVFCGYAGEATNEALASLLAGESVFSGKLAETFPKCIEDTYTGTEMGDGFCERYSDGVFVGYRYYDKYNKDVLFPFGYGLSYAQFEYSDLQVEKKGELEYEVSYNITNTSNYDGKEVSQVYVKDVFCMLSRPEKELKAFAKTKIGAGETKRISHTLDMRAFAYYNTALKKWYVENGAFEIFVGSSSRNLPLKAKLQITLADETQMSQKK